MCTLWASGAGKYVSFYKTPTLLTNKLLLPPCIWNHPRQKHYSNLFAYQIGFENIDYEWVVFAKLPKTSNQLSPHQRAPFQVWRPADPALHDACPAWNGGRRCCWCFSSKVLIVFSKVGGWGLGHGVPVHIVKGGHRWWHCFYSCWWKREEYLE